MRIIIRGHRSLAAVVIGAVVLGTASSCTVSSPSTAAAPVPSATTAAAADVTPAAPAAPGAPATAYVTAATPEQAGEYLTIVGGCNDCHTQGWAETNGNVPQADRLAGNPVGYRGPWGTAYAANLRMVVQRIPEERWLSILKTADGGHGKPPMPWMNTRLMSDQDLRAMYQYIHALGPKGERMPRSVPPGQAPTTPYVDMTVQQGAGK